MIKIFIDKFMENKNDLRNRWMIEEPKRYDDIVKEVITIVTDHYPNNPDPNNIHKIDEGDYQGTYVFIIPEKGYQPSNYWYVRINYGSCCCCDTFESIEVQDSKEQRVDDFIMLALHVVQELRMMDGEEVF